MLVICKFVYVHNIHYIYLLVNSRFTQMDGKLLRMLRGLHTTTITIDTIVTHTNWHIRTHRSPQYPPGQYLFKELKMQVQQ